MTTEIMTEIHLVSNLDQAMTVALGMGALGVMIDMEGVLTRFLGNHPSATDIQGAIYPQKGSPLYLQLEHKSEALPKFIIGTNNLNIPPPGWLTGAVTYVADKLSIPYVHAGMEYNGQILKPKPAGMQGSAASEILSVEAGDMVLIDDQPLKNAGEARRAGFKAIIGPPPVGDLDADGTVIEHPGVRRFRSLEHRILESRHKNHALGGLVFELLGNGKMPVIIHEQR